MVPIKSPNISPKKKWQILITKPNWRKGSNFYFFYNVKTFRKKTLSGRTNISRVKFFRKTFLFHVFKTKHKLIPFVATNYCFGKYPLQEFIWTKSMFGQIRLMPGSDFTKPGFIYFPLNMLLYNNDFYANQYVPLYLVPINSLISNVFDNYNRNITYAVSSGSNAVKKKSIKKTKLTFVELPSGSWKTFSVNTFCLLAPSPNLFINRIILGGWGVFFKKKKKISVRGVAMNPVDHPNGGRTKAKQPELSPWGWVAKLNK